MKVIIVERKKEKEGRVFLLKEVFRECVGMWSQPDGPRMPFDDVGFKQSIGFVNPIQRIEGPRNWRFLEEILCGLLGVEE